MLTYPLEWPIGWARSRSHHHSKFGGSQRWTLTEAREDLEQEIQRLGGRELVISTNVPLPLEVLKGEARP